MIMDAGFAILNIAIKVLRVLFRDCPIPGLLYSGRQPVLVDSAG